MADIAKQTITQNVGLAVVYAQAAAGDTIANFDERDELIVKNGSGGGITVTISSHKNCNQGFDHDLVETLAVEAGEEGHFRLHPKARWANPTTGKLDIAYSDTTSVTRAVIRQPR